MQTGSGTQPVTGYDVDDWGFIPSRDRNFSFTVSIPDLESI
jgi:hypothetical protein